MSTISIYLTKIIEIQTSLGYGMPSKIRNGLELNEIKIFENKCGLKSGQELTDYLLFMDGTNPPLSYGDGTEIMPPGQYFFSSAEMNACVQNQDFLNLLNDYEPSEHFTTHHIPILGENFINCYWLNLDTHDKYFGQILETDMWGGIKYCFKSLTQCIFSISKAYDEGFLKKDNDGHFKFDFSIYSKVCARENPGYENRTK